MPVSCVAYGCSNRYKPELAISFFRFPLNNNLLNEKWIESIKRKKFQPTQWSRICSIHFTENDFQYRPNATRPLLKSTAVPSIFPSFPSYQNKPKKSRKPPINRDDTICIDEPVIAQPLVEVKQEVNNVQKSHEQHSKKEYILRKKLEILRQKLRRQSQKISNLQDLINSLRNKGHIDSEQQHLNVKDNIIYYICGFIVRKLYRIYYRQIK